ncbi:MAG: hypothetical protein IPM21_02050 [Acidobacteria bacterium]|nr:hypothetical protein [Acidobacteriota bacterium]
MPAAANDIAVNSVPTPQPSVEPTPSETWNDAYNFVNGVRIGTSYAELKQRFGKPLSEKRGGENACGYIKTVVTYKGIRFTLDDSGESNIVILIEITSPEWEMTPGVRVGMDLSQVRSKMGRVGLHKIDEVETLGYADGDGFLTFQFTGGKVAVITRELNLC